MHLRNLLKSFLQNYNFKEMKNKKEIKREDKQRSSFLKSTFTYNGKTYKKMTARTLLYLEEVGSTFGDGSLRGLFEVLLISSTDNKIIDQYITDGVFEDKVMEFSEEFTMDDINELSGLINEDHENISASIVEVKESSDTKK